LVNDLLNISFVEMGIFALHCVRCDMGTLCQQLVEEYVAGTNPPPVVTLDVPDEPVEVEVDVDRIGQVMINLLSNARKYSVSNVPIRVTLERDNDECKVSVHDSGIGIAPEVLPHVFERFYRVPGVEVQTGSSVGFGLGLYISKQIVERHSGRMEVRSVLASGSVFSVVLPLIVPDAAATEPGLMSEAQ
jgi:two-component system, sensor histidine kinase and response regulator